MVVRVEPFIIFTEVGNAVGRNISVEVAGCYIQVTVSLFQNIL